MTQRSIAITDTSLRPLAPNKGVASQAGIKLEAIKMGYQSPPNPMGVKSKITAVVVWYKQETACSKKKYRILFPFTILGYTAKTSTKHSFNVMTPT